MIKKYQRFFMRRICTARFSNCCNSRVCTNNNVTRRRKHILKYICIIVCCFLFVYYFDDIFFDGVNRDLAFLRQSRNLSDYIPSDRNTTIEAPKIPLICQAYPNNVLLIYFITSAPSNVVRRQAIRRTWGSVVNPKPIFFIGTTDDYDTMELLEKEAQLFQDIVIEDFVDHYNNLTIKVGFMLKHFQRICPTAKYLMKTDDDVFVNTKLVESIVADLYTKNKLAMIGNAIKAAQPMRFKGSKWYMPKWLYEYDEYPEYLSGAGYILPNSIVQTIFTFSQRTPILHIEDLFFTGVIGNKLNDLSLWHEKRFERKQIKLDRYCEFWKFASCQGLEPEELYSVWKERFENCDTNTICRWSQKCFYF